MFVDAELEESSTEAMNTKCRRPGDWKDALLSFYSRFRKKGFSQIS